MAQFFKLVACAPTDPDAKNLVAFLARDPTRLDPDLGTPLFYASANGIDGTTTPLTPHAQLAIWGLWEKLSSRGLKNEKV